MTLVRANVRALLSATWKGLLSHLPHQMQVEPAIQFRQHNWLWFARYDGKTGGKHLKRVHSFLSPSDHRTPWPEVHNTSPKHCIWGHSQYAFALQWTRQLPQLTIPLLKRFWGLAVMSLKYQRQLVCQGPSWVAKCLQGVNGMLRCKIATHLHLYTLKWALRQTPPTHCAAGCGGWLRLLLFLHVVAWWPRGSNALFGHRAHREPLEVSKPSHHLTATWNTEGSRWRPRPSELKGLQLAMKQHVGTRQTTYEPYQQQKKWSGCYWTDGCQSCSKVDFDGL